MLLFLLLSSGFKTDNICILTTTLTHLAVKVLQLILRTIYLVTPPILFYRCYFYSRIGKFCNSKLTLNNRFQKLFKTNFFTAQRNQIVNILLKSISIPIILFNTVYVFQLCIKHIKKIKFTHSLT